MTRADRSILRQFVVSDSQRLIASKKRNGRLQFKERPVARSRWVCQSTAARLLESGVLERESPGVYVITLRARDAIVEDIKRGCRTRELAMIG